MADSQELHRVFTEPQYSALEGIAREMGVTLVVNRDVELAEQLFQQGLYPSGTEDGRPPKETVYLEQLLRAVQEQNKMHPKLQVYLTDRGYFHDVPETVATLLVREKDKAFHELTDAIEHTTGVLKESLRK